MCSETRSTQTISLIVVIVVIVVVIAVIVVKVVVSKVAYILNACYESSNKPLVFKQICILVSF